MSVRPTNERREECPDTQNESIEQPLAGKIETFDLTLPQAKSEIHQMRRLYSKTCVELAALKGETTSEDERQRELHAKVSDLTREAEELRVDASRREYNMETELKNLRMERVMMKTKENSLNDEVARLQRRVAVLKDRKRKNAKMTEDLKGKLDAAERDDRRDRERMKQTIIDLKRENKRLEDEKAERPDSPDELRDALAIKREENKQLREQWSNSFMKGLELRQELNETVDKNAASSTMMAEELEFYKKNWLVWHEHARQQMNAMGHNLAPDSIPMPHTYNRTPTVTNDSQIIPSLENLTLNEPNEHCDSFHQDRD